MTSHSDTNLFQEIRYLSTDSQILSRVYFSAQVLKTGIILADLPGFRDINLARVKKAEMYQHKCDELFIVANIKRVVSDSSVKDLMTGEFSNPKPNTTVSIICTHADVR